MFKIHPITNLIDLILVVLILTLSKSSILIFIGVLLLLFIAKKHNILSLYLVFDLIILVINIVCGKLLVIGRILTLLGYLLTIFVDYEEIEFIRVYDTLFLSSNYERTKNFLKVLYFKKYFIKNYNIMLDSTRKIGYKNNIMYYIFCIKNAYFLTLKSLDNMIYIMTKRFYFNNGRCKYKIFISISDILMFIIHLVILLIILILGV